MVLGGSLPDASVGTLLVVAVATGLIRLDSGWLEDAAEQLSVHYCLPAVAQGPVVGSAVFNVLVIPALAKVTSESDLDTSRTTGYEEAQGQQLSFGTSTGYGGGSR
jgi:cation:H+ antiporter